MSSLPPPSSRARRAAGLVLLATAFTVVMTWPLARHPASLGRLDTSDGRFSIWNVAWVAHALTTDPSHLFDANIFSPHRGALAYSEANLVAGVLAVPVYALTHDALLAHNSVVFVAFVAAFLFTYALLRRLGVGAAGALVGAVGFTFSPVAMARTAHIQLQLTAVLPASMLAFHVFAERPDWRRAAVLGVTLGVGALACGYYGIFAGLLVGVAGPVYGVTPARRTRVAYWGGLALAAVVSAAVVWPAFRYYLALQEQGSFRSVLDVDEVTRFSADWRAYLASGAHAHAWLLRRLGHWSEVLFPGFVMVVLGGAGLVVARRRAPVAAACYGIAGALALCASFGPPGRLFTLLADALPFMTFVRAPARFGFVVLLSLTVFAAFAADALVRRWRTAAVAVLLVGALVADIAAMPLPYVRSERTPVAYEMLGTLPPGPVIEFPFPYTRWDYHHHTVAMYNSMAHWHPLVNGYSDYVPPDFDALAAQVNGFPDPATFELLHARGVRYVIWRSGEYLPAGREEIARRIARYPRELVPVAKTDGIWLYEIALWPTPPSTPTP